MHIITLLLHTKSVLGSSNFSVLLHGPVILMVHVVLMRLNRGSIYLHYLARKLSPFWLIFNHSGCYFNVKVDHNVLKHFLLLFLD